MKRVQQVHLLTKPTFAQTFNRIPNRAPLKFQSYNMWQLCWAAVLFLPPKRAKKPVYTRKRQTSRLLFFLWFWICFVIEFGFIVFPHKNWQIHTQQKIIPTQRNNKQKHTIVFFFLRVLFVSSLNVSLIFTVFCLYLESGSESSFLVESSAESCYFSKNKSSLGNRDLNCRGAKWCQYMQLPILRCLFQRLDRWVEPKITHKNHKHSMYGLKSWRVILPTQELTNEKAAGCCVLA